MGYQALLFCPDEKTARTVTQVLNELEFSVQACTEPFAAVKKLMAEHFDALVVDCDNEQNAALLFKSARNSTSNQASLAVAVVEGQAGVAKAFRIGSNLVLTKPINVEQAKGTLRVARGLLRKGDPGKPASPSMSQASATPAPAKSPVATAPAASAKPLAPSANSAATARPAAPVAKPAASTPATWPGHIAHSAVASSAPAPAHESEEIEISEERPALKSPAPSSAPQFDIPKVPAARVTTAPGSTSAPAFGGAASAPAPAREPQVQAAAPVSEIISEANATVVDRSEQPAASAPSSSFTFGGANVAEAKSGGNKVLLGVAAVVIIGAALYMGWTQLQSKPALPAIGAAETAPAPATTSSSTKPAQVHSSPAPTTSSASDQTTSPDITLNSAEPAADAGESASSRGTGSAAAGTKSAKTSTSTSHVAAKPAPEEQPDAAPIMVKNGAEPATKKPAAIDAPAPSMTGMTPTSSSGTLPNIMGAPANAPKPVLEALTISQGVSQGLLIRKVQPSYPPNALRMRVEGSVQLLATISRTGAISGVKILSGDKMLTKAATDAVKQWKYKPYLLNGEPVEIQTQVTVIFKVPQ